MDCSCDLVRIVQWDSCSLDFPSSSDPVNLSDLALEFVFKGKDEQSLFPCPIPIMVHLGYLQKEKSDPGRKMFTQD